MMLASTFGLPLLGVALLLVAAMISVAILLARRAGRTVDVDHPTALYLIGGGITFLSVAFYVIVILEPLYS